MELRDRERDGDDGGGGRSERRYGGGGGSNCRYSGVGFGDLIRVPGRIQVRFGSTPGQTRSIWSNDTHGQTWLVRVCHGSGFVLVKIRFNSGQQQPTQSTQPTGSALVRVLVKRVNKQVWVKTGARSTPVN
ncbi:hypothetical protein Hdeb2414_s0005g00184581 [Helianthus debilis subsp. tardiflorus]